MVKDIFVREVQRKLERFFLKKNNFRLEGQTYNLLLFFPPESAPVDYSILLSAEIFDVESKKQLITDILRYLLDTLGQSYYKRIASLNILNSQDPLVRNITLISAYPQEYMELNHFQIGGVEIDDALLVKSTLLTQLRQDNRVRIVFAAPYGGTDTKTVQFISISDDFEIFYLTEKGQDSLYNYKGYSSRFGTERTGQHLAMEEGLAAKVVLDDIIAVYSES